VPVESNMLSIRPATRTDTALILQFIHELAEYERAPNEVVATEADLLRDGFGVEPKYRALIAEWDGQPAGFAFFYNNYSTWRGHAGLHLEDLFVRPQFRSKGIGKALLAQLAAIALRENCYGMRWNVLDWNTPAIDFYKSLGGTLLNEWLIVRFDGEPLRRLAKESRG
jgi:GNAT superfamily N-acetyltransferase